MALRNDGVPMERISNSDTPAGDPGAVSEAVRKAGVPEV